MTDRPNPPASKRAREALAAEYDAHGYPGWGNRLRAGNFHEDMLAPLDAIDAATSTLLDEIEARVRGLKRDAWPIVSNGESPEALVHNQAIDLALAVIASIRGRE